MEKFLKLYAPFSYKKNRFGKYYRVLLVPAGLVENTILLSGDGVEQRTINKDILSKLPRWLNRREQEIISLYYFKQMKMKQIGAVFNLSEARISQLHSAAIAKIRRAI